MASHTSLAGRLLLLIFVAVALVVLAACDSDIDREFGPSALHGEVVLPGRAITTSAPTGL